MKFEPILATVAAAVILLPITLRAADDPSSKIDAFIEAHEKKLTAFGEKMQAASREEQRTIYQNEYPDPSATALAISQIVKANPEDDSSLDGIVWILRYSRERELDPEIVAILEEHHLHKQRMAEVAASLMRVPTPEARALLKKASEESEVKDVRGMAIYALAMGIERDDSKSEEYTALIERLIRDHQDLEIRGRNIAKSAEGKLFAAKNLGIGKPAPEIIGKDVDGKEMKLSDYRGRVVVIDFWGDW